MSLPSTPTTRPDDPQRSPANALLAVGKIARHAAWLATVIDAHVAKLGQDADQVRDEIVAGPHELEPADRQTIEADAVRHETRAELLRRFQTVLTDFITAVSKVDQDSSISDRDFQELENEIEVPLEVARERAWRLDRLIRGAVGFAQ